MDLCINPYPYPWVCRPIPIPTRKIEGTHTLVAGYGYLTGMGPGQGKNTHGLPVSHTIPAAYHSTQTSSEGAFYIKMIESLILNDLPMKRAY